MGPTSDKVGDNAFDTLARGLADGMSRRDALRKGGAAFVTAIALSPADAWAKATGRCPKHRVKCGGTCCPAGEICIKPKPNRHQKPGKPKCGCPPHTPKRCKNTCVNTQTDVHNCGRCGLKCAKGQSCVHGNCRCRAGQTVCAGTCTALAQDPKNCGRCGVTCPSGQVCAGGKCLTTCPAGTVACAGGCVSTQNDPGNCGSCGNACASGQVCTNGVCTTTCATDQMLCAGVCTDVTDDPQNCGTCGAACPSGQVCVNSACVTTCPSGKTACAGRCVDLTNNPNNCGACGMVCATGHVCASSTCTSACANGTVNCSGACCQGTACCGANCQTVHSNGVGQNYYDCTSLANPGDPSTYSLQLAVEAADAFAPGSATPDSCPASGGNPGFSIVTRMSGSQWVTWAYTGPVAGHVSSNSGAPTCPQPTDPTWN